MIERKPATAVIAGLIPWRSQIELWLGKERDYIFVNPSISLIPCTKLFFKLMGTPNVTAYAWGHKHSLSFAIACRIFNTPLIRIEDGFLRSVDLGASKSPPLSICVDELGIYFDTTKPSTLEHLIQNYEFNKDVLLMERASWGISELRKLQISKYNLGQPENVEKIYGPKSKKRILVIGQVDTDMSIVKGCKLRVTSNDVVRLASQENPNAQIIYKPHPEILHRTRANENDPDEVADIAQVLKKDIRLSNALDTIDHVYTITSLAGFEALLRGIKVTCIGAPFYSGWGVTDDRQETPRRTAKRTIDEIFAATYILYPRYFDPYNHAEITFEEAMQLLHALREKANPTDELVSR